MAPLSLTSLLAAVARPAGGGISGWLVHLHGPAAYFLVGLLVFSEAGLLVGVFIPGETAAVAGGVLAAFGQVNLEAMVVVVVLCAIAGDSLGFEVGRLAGPWLIEHRPLRGNPGVVKSQQLLERYGGPAILIGRFVALARALVPGIAGFARLRYRTFLFFNACGGVLWGTLYVLLGKAAGASYQRVLAKAGLWSFVALGVAVVLLVAAHLVRHRREGRRSALGHGARAPAEPVATTPPAGTAGKDLPGPAGERGTPGAVVSSGDPTGPQEQA